MSTRLLGLSDLSEAQLGAWRDLATRAAEPNPFFEPDYVLASIERTGDSGAQLMVVERGGDWLACVPIRRRGAPPLSVLQNLCDEYCFLGTPLVERGAVPEAVEGLLGASRQRHRLLVLQRLALDGPIGATVEQLLESQPYQLVLEKRFDRAAAIHVPGTLPPETPSKEARERGRMERKLERELGQPVEIRDRSDDPAAIEEFIRLEVASWKGRAKTAFGSRPADAAFLLRIATDFRSRGRLMVLELGAAGGEPLASLCSLVAGDAVFWFKTAFDERYRSCAPGVQVMYAGRDQFYAGTWGLLDSCAAPDAALVNRLLPDRRPMATLVIGPSGLRGALVKGAAKAAAGLRR